MKRLIFLLLAVTTLVGEYSRAHAEQREQMAAQYDVYAGGIHVLKAEMRFAYPEREAYVVSLDTSTHGLLGFLVPWRGLFETEGWDLGSGDYRPQLHKSTATWRKETEIKEYTYDKDRNFRGIFIKEHDKERRKEMPDDALTQGTTDILSATLGIMHQIASGGSCEGASDIFDGKRRFVLQYRHEGKELLEQTRYNVFTGQAAQCTVEVIPDGGKWHEKPRGWLSIQEQGRNQGTMPTVWMAQLDDSDYAIPVKVMVKTDYGTMFMHLSGYEVGDKKLVAEKRSKD